MSTARRSDVARASRHSHQRPASLASRPAGHCSHRTVQTTDHLLTVNQRSADNKSVGRQGRTDVRAIIQRQPRPDRARHGTALHGRSAPNIQTGPSQPPPRVRSTTCSRPCMRHTMTAKNMLPPALQQH